MRFRLAPGNEAAPPPPPPRAVRRALPPAGQLRRERRLLLNARDGKLRDLGGLMLEMYRRDQFRQDLLVDRCSELVQLEERLAELDALLTAGAARTSAEPTLAATGPTVTVGPGAPRGTVPVATVTSTLPAAPAPTITTGPLPTAPGSPSTGATATPNPNALAVWPSGESG